MCDNEAVVHIVNKQTSKDKMIMPMVRPVVISCRSNNIAFRSKHLPGFANVVADRLSRFQVREVRQYAPWLNRNPEEILEFLLPWRIP